jgi:TonB family protein
MSTAATIQAPQRLGAFLAEEAACLALGAVMTLGLFVGIAKFEGTRATPPPDIEDIHMATAIPEPPPPSPTQPQEAPEVTAPVTGIEIAASDSPTKLAVVPPDLDKIIPPTDLPPRATIQFSELLTDLRPKAGISADYQHIYQQNEVDQVPRALVKTIARVTKRMRDDAEQLRVTLILVIETSGSISSIRVLKASGNEKFDEAVLDCVRDEWEFSPAVRKGKKVRCMVQQLVWYKWTDEGSPFTL